LNSRSARLDRSFERILRATTARLNSLDAQLHSLSPLAVLERGYALVVGANGTLIRSAKQVSIGDHVTTRLGDGEFTSYVEKTTRKKRGKKVKT
jgi:exodeoxyribonuclease VII large subunit